MGRFYEGFSILPQESHFREELNVSFIALILKKLDASDVRDLSVCLVVLMNS